MMSPFLDFLKFCIFSIFVDIDMNLMAFNMILIGVHVILIGSNMILLGFYMILMGFNISLNLVFA